jgi:hypothetical protein
VAPYWKEEDGVKFLQTWGVPGGSFMEIELDRCLLIELPDVEDIKPEVDIPVPENTIRNIRVAVETFHFDEVRASRQRCLLDRLNSAHKRQVELQREIETCSQDSPNPCGDVMPTRVNAL